MAALSRKGLRGTARLGIPDDYAESFLAEILARFNRRHPLVEVSVVCEASTELAPQVAAGALDLALITAGPRADEGLNSGASSSCVKSRWSGSPPSGFGWRRERQFRSRSAAPTCVWRRATEQALTGTPRRNEDAVLLQELQRDRHALARRAGGDDPAHLDGRSRPPSPRTGPRPARIAPDPHGPHPCARTPERGSKRARRGDPRSRSELRRARPLEMPGPEVSASGSSRSSLIVRVKPALTAGVTGFPRF